MHRMYTWRFAVVGVLVVFGTLVGCRLVGAVPFACTPGKPATCLAGFTCSDEGTCVVPTEGEGEGAAEGEGKGEGEGEGEGGA